MIGRMESCFPDKKTQGAIDSLTRKVDEGYEDLNQRLEGVTTEIGDTVDAAIEQSKIITYPEQKVVCSFLTGSNYSNNGYAVFISLGDSLSGITKIRFDGTVVFHVAVPGTLEMDVWDATVSNFHTIRSIRITGPGAYSLGGYSSKNDVSTPTYAEIVFIPSDTSYSGDIEYTISDLRLRFNKIYIDKSRNISTYMPEGMTYDAATVANISKDSDDVLFDLSHVEYRKLQTDYSQPGDISTYINSPSNYIDLLVFVARVGAMVSVDLHLQPAVDVDLTGRTIYVGNIAEILYNTKSPTQKQIDNACPLGEPIVSCSIWGENSADSTLQTMAGRAFVETNGALKILIGNNTSAGRYLSAHMSYVNRAYPSHEIDSQIQVVS